MRRAQEGRLARLRAHASRTAPEPERVVPPQKPEQVPEYALKLLDAAWL